MIDLHIHTEASGDGELSPKDIIKMAREKELRTIAITDHDSVDSIESAMDWGKKYGVEVIPGCEFSSGYKEKWLHVLGYFIDYHHVAIRQWCNEIQKNRMENVDIQIAKLREVGFYVDKDKVMEYGPQPMPICFSRAIFLDGRNDQNQLLHPYRSKDNGMLAFCLDWIVSGKPYNAPQYIPDVKDVIHLILQCGGVPVLAHPAATLNVDDDSVLNELITLGLKGVEAFSTWHTKEQQEHYYRFGKEKGLIITCGSDFHGKSKPQIEMGQVKNQSYEVVERLKILSRF